MFACEFIESILCSVSENVVIENVRKSNSLTPKSHVHAHLLTRTHTYEQIHGTGLRMGGEAETEVERAAKAVAELKN